MVFGSVMLLSSFLSTAAYSASINQNYVLFPFAHAEIRPDVNHGSELKEFEVEVGTDFVYLLNYKNIRALGEILITSEKVEIERLQAGINLANDSTLWLGRFHTPLGYWNSNYHHGLHLQTSVHRPGIIEYEDDGGPLPNHITGLMLEGQYFKNNGAINYAAAIGYAPTIEHEFKPYEPGSTRNKIHSIFKVSYQFDETNPTESGVVIGQSTINGDHNNIDQIRQNLFGVFSHLSINKSRITAAMYLLNNRILYHTLAEDVASFAAGYAHVEYDVASKWIIYGRVEQAFGADHDPYLELFDHSETERMLGGVRYDINRRHAISSEVSHRISDHDSHTHVSFQWSAVFP